MKKFFRYLGLSLLPPMVLYFILIFEKKTRENKEKLIVIILNTILYLFISSILFNPEIYGISW